MRLWHYKLLPYLPEAQFKGQLRELVAIMHDWRDKRETNHLLINRVTEYPRADLSSYFWLYDNQYGLRFGKEHEILENEFIEFANRGCFTFNPFEGWHNKEYLRVCMANLYEKHRFGIGRSRISHEEWTCLTNGYKAITGENYEI